LFKTVTSGVALDSCIFKSGASAAAGLNAVLSITAPKTTGLDVALLKTSTVQVGIDGTFTAASSVTKITNLDAALQAPTYFINPSFDGLLFRSSNQALASLDAQLISPASVTNTQTISMDTHLFAWYPATNLLI